MKSDVSKNNYTLMQLKYQLQLFQHDEAMTIVIHLEFYNQTSRVCAKALSDGASIEFYQNVEVLSHLVA